MTGTVAKLNIGGNRAKKGKSNKVIFDEAPNPVPVSTIVSEEERIEMKAAEERLTKECTAVLTKILSHEASRPFREPVNWREEKCLDYPRVVKNPMDLGKIQKRVFSGRYLSTMEFSRDVRFILSNANPNPNPNPNPNWMLGSYGQMLSYGTVQRASFTSKRLY